VRALRGLLAGETVEWEGRPIAMIHPDGYGARRPIDVGILIGADGPKGTAVAAELGDGAFSAGLPNPAAAGRTSALLQFGTVLDEGEEPSADRVVETVGPAVAVVLHALYERGGPAAVDALPGGAEWRAALEALPPGTRHLATHAGHLVELTPRDREGLVAGTAAMIPSFTLTGSPAEVRARVEAFADLGVTEVAFQPMGDIGRELAAFADAVAVPA
jgi:5,10-methylenetetrahydromethanopterin reductase